MSGSSFTDKVVVVTGGASGIGRACVEHFAAEGASVLIADVQDAAASELAQRLGERVYAQHCDVSVAANVEAAIDAAVTRFGGLDVLVNNAGIEVGGPLASSSPEIFAQVFAINVIGVFNGLKAAAPRMAERGGGAIVNLASVAGLRGSAMMGPYSASKAAVINLTQTAALEWRAQNIRINCVCPGFIKTPMLGRIRTEMEAMFGITFDDLAALKQQRYGQAEEIAQAILYLASPAASFVSGIAMPVDNALSAGML